MTKKQKAYKKALLRKVHMTKTYLDVYAHDRELWEDFLQASYGVRSSKDLSIDELRNLVDVLEAKASIKRKDATLNQINYILALWQKNSTNKDIFSLLKLAKKILKREIKDLKELNYKEASALIGVVRKLKAPKPVNNVA